MTVEEVYLVMSTIFDEECPAFVGNDEEVIDQYSQYVISKLGLNES